MKHVPTVGVELEYPFAKKDGSTHFVQEDYFQALKQAKSAHGQTAKEKKVGDATIGLATDWGESGLDNGRNNGESALGVVSLDTPGGLARMNEIVLQEIRDVTAALSASNATMLNMSNNPLTPITEETYATAYLPKPVYKYIREYRGWKHMIGIDAKAQNSPSTGCSASDAVSAVNAVMGSAAAFIGLFANSPFQEGKLSAFKETRLSMWGDMFGTSRFESDRTLMRNPKKPFANMREYFMWMFGPGTTMYFVIGSTADYKKSDGIIVIPENPSLLEFLAKDSWDGVVFETGESVKVTPSLTHLELHQFTQFASARIRFAFKDDVPPIREFLNAMSGTGNEVETFFATHAKFTYIEGRDAGATFPDAFTYTLPNGKVLAETMSLSPLALQVGIVRNADAVMDYIASIGWDTCVRLKDAAIKDGLAGSVGNTTVITFAEHILSLAKAALTADEHLYLTYPEHVLSTKQNASERALAEYDSLTGTPEERITTIVRNRFVQISK